MDKVNAGLKSNIGFTEGEMSAQILEFSEVARTKTGAAARWTQCTACNHKWPAVESLDSLTYYTFCPKCNVRTTIGNAEGNHGR